MRPYRTIHDADTLGFLVADPTTGIDWLVSYDLGDDAGRRFLRRWVSGADERFTPENPPISVATALLAAVEPQTADGNPELMDLGFAWSFASGRWSVCRVGVAA